MSKLVIDANVFLKCFNTKEEHSQEATDLLNYIVKEDIRVVLPRLFYYEVLGVTRKLKLPIADISKFLQDFEDSCFHYVIEDAALKQKAIAMCQEGNPKSGYPSFYDCCYHALAIRERCDFVTSDKRHFDKTKNQGFVRLLGH